MIKILNQLKSHFNRLLKNIGLLEALIIFVFIAFSGILFLFLFRKNEYINIRVKVGEENIAWPSQGMPDWYASQIKKGMIEKDLIGRTQAEVINVFSYPVELNKNVVWIDLRIQAVYSKSAAAYTYNGRPVLVGNIIRLNPGKVLIEGLISQIEGQTDSYPKKKIIVETQVFGNEPSLPNTTGIFPHLAEAINIGDEVKDSSGTVVIKIIDKRVVPAKRVVEDRFGNSFITLDSLKQDLFLTLEINASKIGNFYYLFDEKRIAVDNYLPIQLENVIVYPTITKIIED